MSDNTDPATQCCWPVCVNAALLTCGSCGISRYCSKECQVLHWKSGHKIACKRKGRVDFAVFNDPQMTRHLKALDHGGLVEQIRCRMASESVVNFRFSERCAQLQAVKSRGGGSVLFEYYILRELSVVELNLDYKCAGNN